VTTGAIVAATLLLVPTGAGILEAQALSEAPLQVGPEHAGAGRAPENGAVSLRIPRVSRPPKLEDFVRGGTIETEARVAEFRQRSPGDGTPISQSTSAYLSYDDRNLYVVFVCKADPGTVRAHMAKRENIDLDDTVSVYLDTFRDHRRAYVFSANPLGIQRDGILTEGQTDPDYDFDTQWSSEGRLTPDGFAVAIAIPFRSLRFRNEPGLTWGIALNRYIVHTGEDAYWPYVTDRVEGFVQQMAPLEGLEQVPPGRKIELIPYGTFTRSRPLDPGVRNGARVGVDSKIVISNAFAVDLAANPDFSEVESEDPQQLVNQRFEVFFPEKRPFFKENAAFFETPESLFFSRRIADPELGIRFTGKAAGWALGALASDDRAPDESSAQAGSDPSGRRAVVGAFRVQREVADQSTVGVFATSRDVGASSNRVVAVDTRLKLSPTWTFTGQAIHSFDREVDGTHLDGSEYFASLSKTGRHFVSKSSYLDRNPTFSVPLGFIQRVNIRQASQYTGYHWRPSKGVVLSYGPSATLSADSNHSGRLQDWSGSVDFTLSMKGPIQLKASRAEYYEFVELEPLRQHSTLVSLEAAPNRWFDLSLSYNQGTGANYAPPAGLSPFVASGRDASLGLTLRPSSRLRLDQTYLFAALVAQAGSPQGMGRTPMIYTSHVARSKVNYQFTRPLSLRAIVDYNRLLSNPSLFAEPSTKGIGTDLLLTYLVNPGTALYVGYATSHDNIDVPLGAPPSPIPGVVTVASGRRLIVKVSYLFR